MPTKTEDPDIARGHDPRRLDGRRDLIQKEAIASALFGRQARVTTIGRYRVVALLGEGAMGTVFEGVDDELDRTVALKLVRTDALANDEAVARLIREARALARLAHPNVVGIHEVGREDEQVFVAMELVRGQTLRQWRSADERSWAECLAVYIEAGRGLAAAHEAGLVHRDFKPANCILGDDGRVRVLDFGLARGTTGDLGSSTTGASDSAVTDPAGATDGTLTRTGAVLGTPAYMAPEQLKGTVADARSDQFALCTALYEALYGTRPFGGRRVGALLEAIVERQFQPIDARRRRRVPAQLRDIVLRGLATDPEARFGSMDALLEALERFPRRRAAGIRRRVAVVAAAGTVGVWAVIPGEPACVDTEHVLPSGWSDARREALQRSILEVGARADAVWSSSSSLVDRWVADWSRTRHEVCVAVAIDKTTTPTIEARQVACLDRQAKTFDALVGALIRDPQAWQHAPAVAKLLPSVSECGSPSAVVAAPQPAPAEADVVGKIRELLDSAAASQLTGTAPEGLALVEQAEAAVSDVGFAPVRAEIALRRGELRLQLDDSVGATGALLEALEHAESAGDDRIVAEVLLRLTNAANVGGQRSAAFGWLAMARGKLARIEGDKLQRAWLARHASEAAMQAMNYDEALAQVTRARNLFAEAVGSGDARTLEAARLEPLIYEGAGRYAEAKQAHDAVVEQLTASFGMHPRTGHALHNRGALRMELGDLEGALLDLDRALAIFERLPEHFRHLARARIAKAQVLSMRGELETAAATIDRALQPLLELPESDPDRLDAQQWRAAFDLRLRRFDTALDGYQRVAELLRDRDDTDRVALAMVDSNVGECLLALGRHVEADRRFGAALAPLLVELTDDDPRLSYPLHGRGAARLALGDVSDALVDLERALSIATATPGDVPHLALIRWRTAQALTRLGRDPSRARTLAETAATELAAFEAEHAETSRAIDAWLDKEQSNGT